MRLLRAVCGVLVVCGLALAGRAVAQTEPSPAPSPPPPPPEQAAFMGVEMPLHAEGPGVDYTLRATLDPVSHTIKGGGTITLHNKTNADLHELWVHLYMNAFKN